MKNIFIPVISNNVYWQINITLKTHAFKERIQHSKMLLKYIFQINVAMQYVQLKPPRCTFIQYSWRESVVQKWHQSLNVPCYHVFFKTKDGFSYNVDFLSVIGGRVTVELSRLNPVTTGTYIVLQLLGTDSHVRSLGYQCLGSRNILGMGTANQRRRNIVTPSLIGWAHAQDDLCVWVHYTKMKTSTIRRHEKLQLNTLRPADIYSTRICVGCLGRHYFRFLLFLSPTATLFSSLPPFSVSCLYPNQCCFI